MKTGREQKERALYKPAAKEFNIKTRQETMRKNKKRARNEPIERKKGKIERNGHFYLVARRMLLVVYLNMIIKRKTILRVV